MNYKIGLVIALITGGLATAAYHHPNGASSTPAKQVKATDANKKAVCVYFMYDGVGPENDINSYDTTTTAPPSCHGHDIICFFRICDNDGDVTPAEFADAFDDLNLVDPASNLLSDEDEIPGELEKLTLSK